MNNLHPNVLILRVMVQYYFRRQCAPGYASPSNWSGSFPLKGLSFRIRNIPIEKGEETVTTRRPIQVMHNSSNKSLSSRANSTCENGVLFLFHMICLEDGVLTIMPIKR
jgi:hypothetical protein